MSPRFDEGTELARELAELRRVVDDLDALERELSVRVHEAADNAIRAFTEGMSNGHR